MSDCGEIERNRFINIELIAKKRAARIDDELWGYIYIYMVQTITKINDNVRKQNHIYRFMMNIK